jgi:hypothetical protein
MSYIAVNLTRNSVQALNNILGVLDLPKRDEFHITIIHSDVKVHQKPELIKINRRSLSIIRPEIWDTNDGRCLVLMVQDRWLNMVHSKYLEVGATHNYPSFKPHVTLAYDIEPIKKNDYIWLKNIVSDLNLEYDEMKKEDIQ